jgi:hypothetical protein
MESQLHLVKVLLQRKISYHRKPEFDCKFLLFLQDAKFWIGHIMFCCCCQVKCFFSTNNNLVSYVSSKDLRRSKLLESPVALIRLLYTLQYPQLSLLDLVFPCLALHLPRRKGTSLFYYIHHSRLSSSQNASLFRHR